MGAVLKLALERFFMSKSETLVCMCVIVFDHFLHIYHVSGNVIVVYSLHKNTKINVILQVETTRHREFQ